MSPLQVTFLGCAAGAVALLPFAPTLLGELDDAGSPDVMKWHVPNRGYLSVEVDFENRDVGYDAVASAYAAASARAAA